MTSKEEYSELNKALGLISDVQNKNLDIDQQPAVDKVVNDLADAMSYFQEK